MKTTVHSIGPQHRPSRPSRAGRLAAWTLLLLCGSLACLRAPAAVTIYSVDFESQPNVATNLADTANANPTGVEWTIVDDTALTPTTAGAGVQVINWLTNAAGAPNKCLLVRPNSEADVNLRGARSGSKYQLDFWALIARGPTSSQSFYIILRGEGSDFNGDDYLAYRTDRATNSSALFYYDGVGPGTAAWKAVGTNHLNDVWQHHRFVIDPNALTFNFYLDNMVTPILANAELSRCEVAVPTLLRIVNEANSADDGYFAIDDISLTVEDSRDLTTTFTEGFESYPARVNSDDDADPQGPWITTEVDGTGSGRVRAPAKVQVVGTGVVTPHSGTNCLKLEAGQRAGVSLAWGVPPQSDVQITWWARVPASVVTVGTEANYLRMSLYGAENDNTLSGDNALLGYGIRNATVGGSTSLTYYTTNWLDTGVDYTPDTWEEYRLITHTAQGRYTILKNPSSATPQVVVDRAPFIGTATTWAPVFMAGWSSSNGTNHPPVYIDDIEIKSLVSPLPTPYTVQFDGTRFTNVTILTLAGPIGAVAVDPRDNSTIVFTVDASSGGTINKATKVASGNWVADPTPLVTGLSNPSGITIASDGTLWWTHDFTAALMRLKWPWSANSPERVISDFVLPGATTFGLDDDPFDVTFPPPNFNGTIGHSNLLVVMDRGVDADVNDTLFLVDPATTQLDQTNYNWYLFGPTTSGLGSGNLVGMTSLAQSGEIVTLNFDGQVTAVNADGMPRSFWPDFYSDPLVPIAPASIAADPTTGRLWVADDLTNQVWSCLPDGTSGRRELSFPLTNPSRPDVQIDFHEPGMTFAPNGNFMVLSDTSTSNGGGRLLIFHNETIALPTFKITGVSKSAQGLQLAWQSAGSAKYRVQRSANLNVSASFTDISGDLTGTSFTDTNAPSGNAFYRVVAKP